MSFLHEETSHVGVSSSEEEEKDIFSMFIFIISLFGNIAILTLDKTTKGFSTSITLGI
jgi:hypothetical protein